MDIYFHELSSYKREILNLADEIKRGKSKGENLTHFGLAVSNRANLMIIGLCSLVEALLYEIAEEEEQKNNFKIDDLKGTGLKRLKNYITRTKLIDFGKINQWGKFIHIYDIRNAIVHSYGGLVASSDIDKVKHALHYLNLPNILFANKRIRTTPKDLLDLLSIVEATIESLKSNIIK